MNSKHESLREAEGGSAVAAAGSGKPEGPVIRVSDLRRSSEARRTAAETRPEPEEKPRLQSEQRRDDTALRRELTRDLYLEARPSEGKQGYSADKSPLSGSGGSDFQSMLADRLRDSWNGEIVKSAHIVLRDGDSGTIRLRLRPESLGGVKIDLNLSDNSISGKIVVESDAAKTAFERNMSELADAFRREGFESAKLEVSVGSGTGQGGGGATAEGGSQGSFFSERLRSAASIAPSPTALGSWNRIGDSVDILA